MVGGLGLADNPGLGLGPGLVDNSPGGALYPTEKLAGGVSEMLADLGGKSGHLAGPELLTWSKTVVGGLGLADNLGLGLRPGLVDSSPGGALFPPEMLAGGVPEILADPGGVPEHLAGPETLTWTKTGIGGLGLADNPGLRLGPELTKRYDLEKFEMKLGPKLIFRNTNNNEALGLKSENLDVNPISGGKRLKCENQEEQENLVGLGKASLIKQFLPKNVQMPL